MLFLIEFIKLSNPESKKKFIHQKNDFKTQNYVTK